MTETEIPAQTDELPACTPAQIAEVLCNTRVAKDEIYFRTGLTAAECAVLYALANNAPLSMSNLADMIGMSRAGVSRLIQRMELRQWLIRKRSGSDGRITEVHLTDDGWKRTQQFIDEATEIDEEAEVPA
jgi:DNA-binding MarR family transcriptional regulator